MRKSMVRLTLSDNNLRWLRKRATATQSQSLSETLDALVTRARFHVDLSGKVRSVVGTIDVANDDPDLLDAKKYVRSLIELSISRRRQQPKSTARRA